MTRSELSSIASSLEELTKRLSAFAEEARAQARDDLASELFGVERSLTGALRRIRRVGETID